MSSATTVSVITPTYNYGRYLAATIESVLAQTFTNWEMIVVDDGSTDDTPRVIAPYLADPRIRYHKGERLGPSGARNVAVGLSRAPLIAFLDADDLWSPTKLAQQLPLIEADSRVGVVYSRRQLMNADGELLEMAQPRMFRGDVFSQLFRNNFLCFSTVVARRELFDRVGGFGNVPLAVDYDLLLRMAAQCRFDYVDEPLVRYRTGHANLSQRAEERLRVALSIMDRTVACHRARLDPRVVRQAYAETHASLGLVCRERSRMAALVEYGRAIRAFPGRAATWKELASLLLPEGARRLARRALGRPADWRQRATVRKATEAAQLAVAATLPVVASKAALSEKKTKAKHPAL